MRSGYNAGQLYARNLRSDYSGGEPDALLLQPGQLYAQNLRCGYSGVEPDALPLQRRPTLCSQSALRLQRRRT